MKRKDDLLEHLFENEKTNSRSVEKRLEDEIAIARKAKKLVKEIESEMQDTRVMPIINVDAFIDKMVSKREQIDSNASKSSIKKMMKTKRDKEADKYIETAQAIDDMRGA